MIRHALIVLAALLTGLPAAAQVTYTKEISRIFFAKCAQCHRPNDIAPFSLLDYDAASTWAPDIRRVVDDGLMPPWKPVEGHGEFRDSFALTKEEKQQILDWVAAGAPKGDDADMPEPPALRGDWVLGEPDLKLKMAEPFEAPRGRDVYRCFVLDPKLEEDRWVSAVDILPGNRKSVHHVILYLDESGEAEKKNGEAGLPGYTCYGGPEVPLSVNAALGGWAPGSRPHHLPDGIGMLLKKKAKIVMQVHYYTALSTEPDRTEIGLYFSKAKVEKGHYFIPLVQTKLEIPAGSQNFAVKAEDVLISLAQPTLLQMFPHMHMLGQQIKVEVEPVLGGGQAKPLIMIDKWDFNWQGSYFYTKPVPIEPFSRIRLTCTYDNSVNNPRNPSNPPKAVRWGEQTTDEMCVAFMGATFGREDLVRGFFN